MELLLIIFLTLLNGAFAMTELALAASRKSRLNAMSESGDGGAHAALSLLDNPNQFLSTIQIGITSIGVLNGIVGEAAFSSDLAEWLKGLGMPHGAASLTATGLVVTIITITTIIFGELVPKRIGQLYPETISRWASRPMLLLARASGPLVHFLSGSTAAVLRLLRIDAGATRPMTEEEISASLEEGVDSGVIEEHEHQMVQNVFELDDRPLTSLMVSRSEIDWLDASLSVAQALQKLAQAEDGAAHSWYPVCRGSLADVVGQISVSQLLKLGEHTPGSLADLVMPSTFVPETLTGMELLEHFRARQGRLVLVVDEYGEVQGMLTPFDLLEAITGELHPGASSDAWATELDDGSWLLDGLMPISELKARLGLEDLPMRERGRYNTVAGLVMAVMGSLPRVGEHIDVEGWRFQVLALDGKRVDEVRASPLPTSLANPES